VSTVFTASGARNLRVSWVILALSIVAAILIVLASQWYREREHREGSQAERRLQEARGRVEAARRERDSLQESADVFRDGWVRTRDLATVDDRGYLHLSGRTRDVVIVNARSPEQAVMEIAQPVAAFKNGRQTLRWELPELLSPS